jgi:hypothetical protein
MLGRGSDQFGFFLSPVATRHRNKLSPIMPAAAGRDSRTTKTSQNARQAQIFPARSNNSRPATGMQKTFLSRLQCLLVFHLTSDNFFVNSFDAKKPFPRPNPPARCAASFFSCGACAGRTREKKFHKNLPELLLRGPALLDLRGRLGIVSASRRRGGATPRPHTSSWKAARNR